MEFQHDLLKEKLEVENNAGWMEGWPDREISFTFLQHFSANNSAQFDTANHFPLA